MEQARGAEPTEQDLTKPSTRNAANPGRLPSRRRLLVVTALFASVLVVVTLLAGYYYFNPGPCACGQISERSMELQPGATGSCGNFTTIDVQVISTTALITTSDFGIAIEKDIADPAGIAGRPDATACGVSPPSSGWDAELISAVGSVQEAYFDAEGWHGWNATLPDTITAGQTIRIVAPSDSIISGAVLSVFGMDGASVTGSATL